MPGVVYEFGEFRLVVSARELLRAGRRVELPRRTFECIEHLLAHRDRAVGRDELVAAVFGRSNVSDAQLGQIVLRARRALDDDGNAQRVIRTIAGFGYRWVADVRAREVRIEEMPPLGDAAALAATDTASPIDSAPAAVQPTQVPADPEAARPPFPRIRRRTAAGAIVIAAMLIVVTFAFLRGKPARQHAQEAGLAGSVIVLPVQVDGLREDGWVRLGAMDLVAGRLREAGLAVPPSENVLALLNAQTGASADTYARQVRATTSARLVVQAKATRSATGWKVELSALPEHGLAVPVQFSERDAVRAARGASDLLLAALGRSLPPEAEREAEIDETLQRVRAAMLANELETARSILSAAPQLAQSRSQLDYRLAQVDLRAGELDRAEASLDDVLARADAGNDARFRAQVLTARGQIRVRRGAFADAGRDFEAAIGLLGPQGNPLEVGQALVGRGNCRVAEHRFGEALADLGAARVALESAGDTLGVARADANVGMLELYRGRPAEAAGYLAGAADRFESFGALHELLVTLSGVIDAQLSLLQRDDAWKTVERAWALRERISDPDQRIDMLLNRAQVLFGLGRYHEAAALLAQANRSMPSKNAVMTARTRALSAELAARQAHWREAADVAREALAEWPSAGADAERSGVALIHQRALLALGEADAANALLDRTRAPPAAPSDEPGRVADALAMAEWATHAGDSASADAWFRSAMASADRRGVPAEIVAVADAYAPALLAAGDHARAAVVIGRVAPWAARDFDCALLQLRLFHSLEQHDAWFNALRQAQTLAGEREIPQALQTAPQRAGERALRLSGT